MRRTFVLAALVWTLASNAEAQTVETRVQVKTPPTTDGGSLAISPDGTRVVFAADIDGKYRLWVHSLASGVARPLPGTEDVSFPFPCWSPDSRSIAYVSSGRLRRLDVETGASQPLMDVGNASRGCSWNRDGTILFAVAEVSAIGRVSEQGGRGLVATMPQRGPAPDPPLASTVGSRGVLPTTGGERGTAGSRGGALNVKFFVAPHLLPDGKYFLCYSEGGVYIGEVGAAPRSLLKADSAAYYVSGHLLFVRQETLYAQPFDAKKRKLSGVPVAVAKDVPVTGGIPALSVSAAGHIVYRTGPGGSHRQFKWFSRTGSEIASVGNPMTMADGAPSLSSDGSTLALRRTQDGNNDIWLLDVADGALQRVTSDKANDGFPVWSVDGSKLYFASNRKGPMDLFEKPAVGPAKEKSMLSELGSRLPKDVSPDGRFLLYTRSGNIQGLELNGKSREFEVIMGPGLKDFPQFSPDGRLIAYQSNESGRFEIYIQQFLSGTRGPITSGGGAHVRWRRDGKELFYIAPNGMLMAVPVTATGTSQELRFGVPTPLFAPPIVGNVITSAYGQQYAVSPDGQRFLVATATKTESLTVIQNWAPAPASK